jgi:hypothetical protein
LDGSDQRGEEAAPVQWAELAAQAQVAAWARPAFFPPDRMGIHFFAHSFFLVPSILRSFPRNSKQKKEQL